ncbi:nuclear export mediator factor NEMF homolog [Ischnura elegans]|uniref:nuclear export mediator factor NEMF homolog n=1 Tax=Ischnura elegans TaxID=197161 RepID=UPI001ED8AAAA|nr:nuclear export mediator factor NEMF homolog [Ischnura elegans]
MKSKFSTYDLICIVTELQKLVGMRLHQIYDVDNKTYLFKFQKPDEKAVLLIESGSRIHTTAFEWPKNVAPSSFSMKMRKHLRNKRLEAIKQLGIDRVVDMQFGTGDAEYHVILELYDKGNLLLTDGDLVILNVLRPHVEGEEVRFAVREKYPVDRARQPQGVMPLEQLTDILNQGKIGDNLKKILNPKLEYGPAVIEHMLLSAGFPANCKLGKTFDVARDVETLYKALIEAENIMTYASKEISKGYIVQKMEKKVKGVDGDEEVFYTNQEFHPIIFRQHANQPIKEFSSFDVAVDEFFSSLESQKIDMKALQQEREALKKLENVRKDHVVRVEALGKAQEEGRLKAELIEKNLPLVENAILAVRAALATQASWEQVQQVVADAAARGDPVASSIHALKLQINNITMKLADPYADYGSSDDDDDDDVNERVEPSKPMLIDIDLDLSAYANARAYYDQKRSAAKKQQKTLDSEKKALKSAERKTKQALKEVQAITTINKARKVFWFEKFFWFISSENYLVIGGRDQQQNEIVVKKHLRANDIYVHADLQGASSVIIKNPQGGPVPPKTLNEAGVMAVSYSIAWEAKVPQNVWWVHSDQVSKTAPTGEYLTTGSFMIRGKKNYLPPCHLIMGFSFLFKLEESSVFRHADERKVRSLEEDELEMRKLTLSESIEGSVGGTASVAGESVVSSVEVEEDQEIELEGDSDDEEAEKNASTRGSGDECPGGIHKSEEEEEEEEDDEETCGVPEFPDTQIKFEHTGGQISLVAEGASILKSQISNGDEDVVYLGDDKPVKLKPSENKKKPKKDGGEKNAAPEGKQKKQKNSKKEKDVDRGSDSDTETKVENQVKRGQRGKLKKIKEKYKYQDEEERKLRMEILQSAGSAKESNRKKGKQDQHGGSKKNPKKNEKKGAKRVGLVPFSGTGMLFGEEQVGDEPANDRVVVKEEPKEDINDDDDEDINTSTKDELDILNSLTGQPVAEDELLFAIPTVAPYNALANCKYKVKLTPGTGKRGKAAKTALNMFLKDKASTSREKDLLKSVKDQDIARNIPGKVKVSAPMLQKKKK